LRLLGIFAGLTLVNNLGMAWAYSDAYRRLALDLFQMLCWLAVVVWALRVEQLSLASSSSALSTCAATYSGGWPEAA